MHLFPSIERQVPSIFKYLNNSSQSVVYIPGDTCGVSVVVSVVDMVDALCVVVFHCCFS